MRTFIISLAVAGAVSLSFDVSGAWADTPHPLSGAYSKEQMKKICVGQNGMYYETQPEFGCEKPCKGGECRVDCSGEGAGECTGWTPMRIPNPTIRRILAGGEAGPPAAGPLETGPGGTPRGPSGIGTPKPTAPSPSGPSLR